MDPHASLRGEQAGGLRMDRQAFDSAFTFKDNPAVAETYVDGIHLAAMHSHIFRLTFTVSRADEPKPGRKGPPTGQKVVAERLIMSLECAAQLYNRLDGMFKTLEAEGVLTRDAGAVKPTVQ